MGQRSDAIVDYSLVGVDHQHPREVRALMPQLGTLTHFGKEVGDNLARVDMGARQPQAEPRLGQMAGEYSGVVSIALYRARVAGNPVLL